MHCAVDRMFKKQRVAEYLKGDGNMDWEEGATKGYEGSGVTFRRESN